MCWTLDSQHCLGGEGVDIIGVLIKILTRSGHDCCRYPFTILVDIISNNIIITASGF